MVATARKLGESALRIVWIYPDLLSTYGDQGNALILAYRAAARGHRVERVDVRSDQAVPADADIYLIGGGEDRPQRLAAERLRRDLGLGRAAERGAAILAVCAGFQLLGHTFYDEQEGVLPGLGLIDATSHRGSVRCVGEVVADPDPALTVGGASLPPLTGFENHMGTTLLWARCGWATATARGRARTARTSARSRGRICTARCWRATRPWPTCCWAGRTGTRAAPPWTTTGT
jgi:CobQ-like glutamine amidotransferase family enzyme